MHSRLAERDKLILATAHKRHTIELHRRIYAIFNLHLLPMSIQLFVFGPMQNPNVVILFIRTTTSAFNRKIVISRNDTFYSINIYYTYHFFIYFPLNFITNYLHPFCTFFSIFSIYPWINRINWINPIQNFDIKYMTLTLYNTCNSFICIILLGL